jgi:tetratricopeptide (TPR) repeat protein
VAATEAAIATGFVRQRGFIAPVPALVTGFAAGLLLVLSACQDAEPALARGDRFWADSNYTDALAEYRLALRQHPDEETRARTAHAYIATGQFEMAREIYADLIQEAPKWTDQAIFDYVEVANRARDRSDRYGLASAVAAAQELRPGLPLDDFAIPLARYYSSTGDPALALDFYERALTAAPPDTVPALLFEMAQIHEQLGNCPEAIGFYRAFRSRAPKDERVADADWHIGDCSFTLARRAHQDGDLDHAMDYVDEVLDLGVPRNLLDEAWFERGEILLEQGQREEALLAYRMVVQLNPTGTGQMVERARRRIDDLRFGRMIGR